MVDERPGCGDRGRVPVEAEPFEAAGAQLLEQRAPRGLELERPGLNRRDAQRRRRDGRQLSSGCARVLGGREDLARLQHRALVGERLPAVVADIFGRAEFAGREVEQRDTDDVQAAATADRRNRHQERRLAGVEVVGVGQRAGRDDAHDLALDEPFGLARIRSIADGDAKAALDEARDVAVDRMEGDAAHRDAAAVRILRPRGQRQFEGAGRDQRVLIEELVEIAHSEHDDGIAMLLLGVEILAHRGRYRGRRGHME